MPNIRSSADLRNNYNDISSYCHAYNEPVFITKNGKGDLAVMSMETYEEMAGRIELYSKLQCCHDSFLSAPMRMEENRFCAIEHMPEGKRG